MLDLASPLAVDRLRARMFNPTHSPMSCHPLRRRRSSSRSCVRAPTSKSYCRYERVRRSRPGAKASIGLVFISSSHFTSAGTNGFQLNQKGDGGGGGSQASSAIAVVAVRNIAAAASGGRPRWPDCDQGISSGATCAQPASGASVSHCTEAVIQTEWVVLLAVSASRS
jgi:hypothetical protein